MKKKHWLVTLKTVAMGVLGAALQAVATSATNPNGLNKNNIKAVAIGGALAALAGYFTPSPVKTDKEK